MYVISGGRILEGPGMGRFMRTRGYGCRGVACCSFEYHYCGGNTTTSPRCRDIVVTEALRSHVVNTKG